MSIWNNIMAAFTPTDLNALERLCKVVDATVAGYADAGAALQEIRDRQLFRATHSTFDAFLKDRWNFSLQHAHRIIAAAAVARNVAPTGETPRSERLARPLTTLEPAAQIEAWSEARAMAANDPVRPEHVREAVAKRRGKTPAKSAKPIRIRVPGGTVTIEPNKSFESASACLTAALDQLRTRQAA